MIVHLSSIHCFDLIYIMLYIACNCGSHRFYLTWSWSVAWTDIDIHASTHISMSCMHIIIWIGYIIWHNQLQCHCRMPLIFAGKAELCQYSYISIAHVHVCIACVLQQHNTHCQWRSRFASLRSSQPGTCMPCTAVHLLISSKMKKQDGVRGKWRSSFQLPWCVLHTAYAFLSHVIGTLLPGRSYDSLGAIGLQILTLKNALWLPNPPITLDANVWSCINCHQWLHLCRKPPQGCRDSSTTTAHLCHQIGFYIYYKWSCDVFCDMNRCLV